MPTTPAIKARRAAAVSVIPEGIGPKAIRISRAPRLPPARLLALRPSARGYLAHMLNRRPSRQSRDRAKVAQLVERAPEKGEVRNSIFRLGTMWRTRNTTLFRVLFRHVSKTCSRTFISAQNVCHAVGIVKYYDHCVPRKRSGNCLNCGALKILLSSGALRCRACANRWTRKKYHTNQQFRLRALERHVSKRYGSSLKDLEQLLLQQGERCAICLRHWRDCKRTKRARYDTSFLQHLNVDHDHRTGAVRGLLCHGCNAAIGQLEGDPIRIRRAKNYLLKYKAKDADLP